MAALSSEIRPSTRIHVAVHAIEPAAIGIVLLDLRPIDPATFVGFSPGAHIYLHLPGGLSRAYSLINCENDGARRYLIAVARATESRGGSAFLHEGVSVGYELAIDPPANHFPLDEAASHSVLLAGGIGVTPILAMARRLSSLGRPWQMLYCARSRGHAAFVPELERLGALPGGRVAFHFDDERSTVPDLASICTSAPTGAHFYCCGPQPFMAAFRRVTEHVPDDLVHTESFSPVEIVPEELGGFQLVLAQSGQELDVPPGTTILAALREIGLDPPALCEEGTCGSCEVAVLEGEPLHRDHFLTEADRRDNATMMICCSGCRTPRLVIDL